jgi:hypothetical protein
LKISISLQIEVVGTVVKEDGPYLVVDFEGNRKELRITGLEQNADWALNYGKGSDSRNSGTGKASEEP